jgi:hypothetical protein
VHSLDEGASVICVKCNAVVDAQVDETLVEFQEAA